MLVDKGLTVLGKVTNIQHIVFAARSNADRHMAVIMIFLKFFRGHKSFSWGH